MKIIPTLFILSSIFFTSIAAYADNLHIQNRSAMDTVIAKVYLNGHKTPDHTIILKPGQEYIQDLWHNLAVNLDITNQKTNQSCNFIVEEIPYFWNVFITKYEPKVGNTTCSYYSNFDQSNWQTHLAHYQDFSYVNVWAPWS